MAFPPLPLPAPGQENWATPLNNSLTQLNDELSQLNDFATAFPALISDSGRLGIRGVVATDLNLLNESGWARADSNALNRPVTGAGWFNVLTLSYGATSNIQLAVGVSGVTRGRVYVRTMLSGAREPWVQLGAGGSGSSTPVTVINPESTVPSLPGVYLFRRDAV